ncbi:MAG TPA: DUF2284 domain-containing protein [Thermodesulfobacteriota bacterium]|nr:DUF2284 domain-containing protein [Thermodesulfobacteriota bacterium]
MNKVSKQINYCIDNIERSIVADTSIGTKYSAAQKKKLYREKEKLVNTFPALKKLLDIKTIHTFPVEGVKNFGRIGFLPIALVISDDRIKDMCQNQWWVPPMPGVKAAKKFMRCPGLGHHSSCPYFTPPAVKVRQMLDKADIFIVLQSTLFNYFGGVTWQWNTINTLREKIEALFGKKAVLRQFGAGPCQYCYPEPCLTMGKCRHPEKQVPALEAMGVPVAQLCRDLSLVTGDKSWEIKWIKHWGFPNQTPKKWKVNFALAVKLPKAGSR